MNVSAHASVSSLETLYCDHYGWLQRWLHRRLGNVSDAADLAHDTFIRLLTKPSVRGFGSFAEARAYLRATASGLCVDLWRHREVEAAWLQTLAAQPEPMAPSPEHQAIIIETLLEIGAMLGRLPRKAAVAFIMARVDGAPYRDIAAALAVSERMVKKYIAQVMLQCALIEAGLTG